MTAEPVSLRQQLPVTPLEAIQKVVRSQVIVEGQTFWIEIPADSDRLMDHPAIRAAFLADEYLPYWADLWPASRMLAKAVLREPWPSALDTLEIGCGLGLPGIAALSRGLRVTFSDCDSTALRFAADNARLNGFNEFGLVPMDWRYPPQDLQAAVILASDLLYELRNVEPIVALIKRVLRPGGLCLLTDQDRVPAATLREVLTAEGFVFTTQAARAGEPGGRRVKGSLYRIQHRT